jgi:hypothetical protein
MSLDTSLVPHDGSTTESERSLVPRHGSTTERESNR